MRSLFCHGLKCRASGRTWMVRAVSEHIENIGAVSQSRYEQIVAELRKVVEQQTRGKFTIGDRALEIEPVRPCGGTPDTEWTVRESLVRLAEDIGLTFNTVKNARWIASRWPKEHRQADVSFTIHRILGRIEDDQGGGPRSRTLPRAKRGGRRTTPSGGSAGRSTARRPRRSGSPRSTTWPRTRRSPRP